MTDNTKRERYPINRPVEASAGRTGSWRVFRPVIDRKKCNACGLCFLYCPDAVIDRDLALDLTFCKGCGICANECPKNAIVMVREER